MTRLPCGWVLGALGILSLAAGCSGSAAGDDEDGSDPAEDSGALPCADPNVSRVPIAGLTGAPEGRVVVAMAGVGNELVLVWSEHDLLGGRAQQVARIRNPAAPVAEPLAAPLPVVAALGSRPDGVRFFFDHDADPSDGFHSPAWADLRPDGTFGPLTATEIPRDGVGGGGNVVIACIGEDPASAFVVGIVDGEGWPGFMPGLVEEPGPRFLAPVVSRTHWAADGTAKGCTASNGIVTLVVDSPYETGLSTFVRWSAADGNPLAPPAQLGDEGKFTLAFVSGEPTAFGLRVESTGVAAADAYRFAAGTAERIASREVDATFGSDWPFPMGAMPTASGVNVLYNDADTLFLVPFSTTDGFGPSALLTDAGCRGNPQHLVTLPSGTFLPCARWDRLFLLTMCREGHE